MCFKKVGKLSEIILFPILWIQWMHCRDHSSNNDFNVWIYSFWIIFPWYFWDLRYYCFVVFLYWNSWENCFLLLIVQHQGYIIETNILCTRAILKLVEVLWLFVFDFICYNFIVIQTDLTTMNSCFGPDFPFFLFSHAC